MTCCGTSSKFKSGDTSWLWSSAWLLQAATWSRVKMYTSFSCIALSTCFTRNTVTRGRCLGRLIGKSWSVELKILWHKTIYVYYLIFCVCTTIFPIDWGLLILWPPRPLLAALMTSDEAHAVQLYIKQFPSLTDAHCQHLKRLRPVNWTTTK